MSVHSLPDFASKAWAAKRNGRDGADAMGTPRVGRRRSGRHLTLLRLQLREPGQAGARCRPVTTKGVARMGTDDDEIRRWTVEDYENTRFEDDHVEPYVNLRRISADPA